MGKEFLDQGALKLGFGKGWGVSKYSPKREEKIRGEEEKKKTAHVGTERSLVWLEFKAEVGQLFAEGPDNK